MRYGVASVALWRHLGNETLGAIRVVNEILNGPAEQLGSNNHRLDFHLARSFLGLLVYLLCMYMLHSLQ